MVFIIAILAPNAHKKMRKAATPQQDIRHQLSHNWPIYENAERSTLNG
jgi:hypothetical protein